MAQRRFGPTLDAGTVIIEKEGEKTIEASQLGSTAYTGILERGAVGELITTTGKKDLLAKTGGFIPDSLLPDCAQDFWDHSDGAGILFLYRVTDGNEKVATLTLWDRKTPRNQVIRCDAHNGGSWGGKRDTYVVDLSATGDIYETYVELPIAFHPIYQDQFKGGTLYCSETGTSYTIVGNDASDGVAKTRLDISSDSTLKTDYGSGTDLEFAIELESVDEWGRDRMMSVEILDGQVNPSTEWGMYVYVNDSLVKAWSDLSSDPNASNYFVKVINDDTSNWYITVTDLWSGAVTADTRPANFFAEVADSEIAEKQLDLATVLVEWSLVATGGASTLGAFTYGSKVIPDTYEIEYNGATWDVTSLNQQATHAFGAATGGTPYAADNDYSFGFTVTEATPAVGDKFTVYVLPLEEDEAIDGRIFFPEETFAPGTGWLITDNTESTADITSGDMTNGGAISGNIKVRLQYRQQLVQGYDGIATVDENDFLPAYDVNASPFNDTEQQGYGLIKHATPGVNELSGVNALVVQQAGVNYADAKNHQFRPEFDASITDEVTARDWVQNTLGKSDYEKIIFPSYADVTDPVKTDLLKTIPVTGMVHGREAKIARDYNGYHKVAAGEAANLPRIRQIPTGDRRLNGEVLNPAGIQRIEKRKGRFIIWGAKIPYVNSEWKFCQHRELMSYYEHVLIENFDWVIFAINDRMEQPRLIAALQSFFYPEWTKRALRGNTFEDACEIKIDEENNTDATRAAGDMNCDLMLQLADTIERFIITMGKQGVFESTAA